MKLHKFFILCVLVLLYVSCTHSAPTYPNMLADVEPFSVGSVDVSLDRIFSSDVKGTTVEVVFYPRENAVALEFGTGLGGQYQQFWDEAGRQKFIEALNGYKDDFGNQKLTTKYNKSRAIYGKAKGWFQWKSVKVSPSYQASPVFELGYRFRDGSPYFAVLQKTAREETEANKKGITESPQYSIYFTRAQAEDLAALFDQAFLRQSLGDLAPPPAAPEPAKDVYKEK